MQQTFDGTAAADMAEFESSEEPTSPWTPQPEHAEIHIACAADAREAWAATQTPEQKELRKASHALWLEKRVVSHLEVPLTGLETLQPGPCDQRDFFGRPRPSAPPLSATAAPLADLVDSGAIVATPRSIAWAEEVRI